MSVKTTHVCDKCGAESPSDEAQNWFAAVFVESHTVHYQEDDDTYDDDDDNICLRVFGHSCRVCHAEMLTKIRGVLMEYGLREDGETKQFYRPKTEPVPLPD